MAQFFGKSFVWKGIPSEAYGLYIMNLDNSGIYDSPNGSDIEIYKQQIIRKPVPYTFGFSQSPVLEFELEIGSFTQLSSIDRDIIGRWLFGQQSYDKLQIMQDDMDQMYFNCIITNSTKRSIGNLTYAFKVRVVCDSPFAWTFPQTYTYIFAGNSIIDQTFTFFNDSSNSDYIYPQLNFSLNTVGTYFTLTNLSDASRVFSFTGLSGGQAVQVDNDRQIITPSGMIQKFNLGWFRLVPGINTIHVQSGIGSFSVIYNLARKIGG